MQKFIDIFSSARFVQLFVVAILQALVLFRVIDTEQGTGLINIISALFAGSVVIGTVDRASENKVAAAIITAEAIASVPTKEVPLKVAKAVKSKK